MLNDYETRRFFNNEAWFISSTYPATQTIFYSGVLWSQTHLAKYASYQGFKASTGEYVAYKQGLHELAQPLDVIAAPFVSDEIADVNLSPFAHWSAYVNPITWGFVAKSYLTHWWYNIEITKSEKSLTNQKKESVAYHSIHLNQLSIAQETDIESHQNKYDTWQTSNNKTQDFIAYGVSRGAATTLIACAKNHYRSVKLIILEGCFLSIKDTIDRRFGAFSFFMHEALQTISAYKEKGIAPIECLDKVPKGIPIAFISSLKDKEVPYESVKRLAQTLANKNRNDIYFLTLYTSSHPNYMHDNLTDRHRYQQFMHALYKKYALAHKPVLAEQGTCLLENSLLTPYMIISNEDEDEYKKSKSCT